MQLHVSAFECTGHKWPSHRRHAALAAGSTFGQGFDRRQALGTSSVAHTRSYRGTQDLISWMCGCTCASAEAERTAGTDRLDGCRPSPQRQGSSRPVLLFTYCQPAPSVSDLADVLLVSHFELLILVVCSFFASNRLSHVLDVSSRPCLYGFLGCTANRFAQH